VIANVVQIEERNYMTDKPKTVTCGLIMPISVLDGCSAEHWAEVKLIMTESIEKIDDPKFTVKLVSDADDVGVIQKRIVQNVYTSDIIVCDVSGRNSNVMFELGMRLAFDKPTVIVKDDKTDYSFDTGIIEHVPYPRDLRFGKIVEFKTKLAAKVSATYAAAIADPSHSPFLKNFGKFKVAALDQTEITPDKMMVEMLSEMQQDMSRLRRTVMMQQSRGELESPKEDLTPMIHNLIVRYAKEHNVERLSELINDKDFLNYIEREVGAPKFFRRRDTFLSVVMDVLKSCA